MQTKAWKIPEDIIWNGGQTCVIDLCLEQLRQEEKDLCSWSSKTILVFANSNAQTLDPGVRNHETIQVLQIGTGFERYLSQERRWKTCKCPSGSGSAKGTERNPEMYYKISSQHWDLLFMWKWSWLCKGSMAGSHSFLSPTFSLPFSQST